MRKKEEWPIIGLDIGFVKYANAEIVNIMTSPAQQAVLAGLMKPIDTPPKTIDKSGAYEKFKSIVSELKKVAPKSEDFLYVHVRAITAMEAGCLCRQEGFSCACGAEGIKVNSNGDAFPEEELLKGYKTFIAKGNFVDHESSQIDKIRGIIIDAHWNPEGKYVECLLAVDRKSHPQLARDIETGVVHGVSMGCQVAESECSICHNKAQMESAYCFPAGTPITLANGAEKPIEAIAVQDKVISHLGNVHKVTKIFNRNYSGDLLRIKVHGIPDYIEATPNHPFFVICPKVPRTFTRAVKKLYDNGYLKPKFVAAEELEVGAYLAVAFDSTVDEFPEIKDMNWARLLGLYLAEGSIGHKNTELDDKKPKQINWVFSSKEKQTLAKEVVDICYELFGYNAEIKDVPNNGCSVTVHSTEVAKKIANLCGFNTRDKARDKELSRQIMTMRPEWQKEFLKYWLQGDGYQDKVVGHIRGDTVSRTLAKQLQTMSFRCGLPVSLVEYKRTTNIGEYSYPDHVMYRLTFSSRMCKEITEKTRFFTTETKISNHETFISGNYYITAIKSITSLPFEGMVFNFEVEEDHGYLVGGIAVHNCTHIKNLKGLKYGNKTVYEINRGLNFIELSWVTNPADSQCTSIRKIAKTVVSVEKTISTRQRSLNRIIRKQQVS